MSLVSPKLTPADRRGYRYYAGFSGAFVEGVLDAWDLPEDAHILDPWNGSGTTTSTAAARGYHSIGFDLNPVAVVLARARLLDASVASSLVPLGEEIAADAARLRQDPYGPNEPLLAWFDRTTAHRIRRIEVAIRRILVGRDDYRVWHRPSDVEAFSAVASFYLSAVFLVARRLVRRGAGTNPTWVKWRKNALRISLSFPQLTVLFREAVSELAAVVAQRTLARPAQDIRISDSRRLPLASSSVDAVVTSPPYCTRLDYVVATLPELAILGCQPGTGGKSLREAMLGTTITRQADPENWQSTLGEECTELLDAVATHKSKASDTYYFRFYLQYFLGLQESLAELRRVLIPGGRAAIVVQDSHYKNIHIGLGDIVSKMGTRLGWVDADVKSFEVVRPLVQMNPRAAAHLPRRRLFEHVVVLEG